MMDPKWYYQFREDSEIHGPVASEQMLVWARAGYFDVSLALRTDKEEVMHTLQEWMTILNGQVPFIFSDIVSFDTTARNQYNNCSVNNRQSACPSPAPMFIVPVSAQGAYRPNSFITIGAPPGLDANQNGGMSSTGGTPVSSNGVYLLANTVGVGPTAFNGPPPPPMLTQLQQQQQQVQQQHQLYQQRMMAANNAPPSHYSATTNGDYDARSTASETPDSVAWAGPDLRRPSNAGQPGMSDKCVDTSGAPWLSTADHSCQTAVTRQSSTHTQTDSLQISATEASELLGRLLNLRVSVT